MFKHLSQRFDHIFKILKNDARLTETNTKAMLREIRIALLEADVALPVVKDLIAKIQEKALGQEVSQSLTPDQALVSFVKNELAAVMGEGENNELNLQTTPPATILLAGLQGSGKTTSLAKLASWLTQEKKKKVLAVSCDIYRPAAMLQLQTLCQQIDVAYFAANPDQKPLDIVDQAKTWAKNYHYDVLLIDTAGRTGIDEKMMTELNELHTHLSPIETLYVVDAMSGQDALQTAQAYALCVPLTGIILTKLDGDARGGAALSARHVTGCPIKFIGVGEKLSALQVFNAEQIARRILGMGDILALVAHTKKTIDEEPTKKIKQRMQQGLFDLNDFKLQISQTRRAGILQSFINHLPEQLLSQMPSAEAAEKQIKLVTGIIDSMTPLERTKSEIIKASRKTRIAAGAGVKVQDVNRMLAQFEQMRTFIKKYKSQGKNGIRRLLGF